MHECLIKMESKKFPGLISLIVDAVFDYIVSEDRDLVLANFGSGSMEIERQVINKLLKVGFNKKVVFIGFDNSSIVKDVAKNNLVELQNNISLLQEDKLDNRILNSVQKAKNNYIIILCNNNIFNVRKYFKRKSFDLIYHSLFKHHLSEIEKKKLNELTIYLSNQSFEYDGYRSWFQMIPQSIFTWKNPVFLSANIFSNLRFPSKSRIRKENEDIKFNKFGYYLVKHGYFRI